MTKGRRIQTAALSFSSNHNTQGNETK
jgi:hypothetical protein